MRAQILDEQKPVEERPLRSSSRDPGEPGEGEVRLKITACAVCHTDLHIVEGELPPRRLPVVPGHQIVGIVEAAGAGVSRPVVGERAGVGWLYRTCESCEYCRRGNENLCPNALFTGYDADGGYQESVVVPASFTFPIPETFPDSAAAPLLCAGIIGYRSLRMASVEPGTRVGLFGFGASAHLALQVSVHWKCRTAVVTRGEAHRDLARDLGADWVGGPGESPPWPLDSAIVFAPAGAVVRDALASVRPGGVVAINAIHLDELPAMPYSTLYGERTLRSVTNFTRDDARAFLALAGEIPLRVEHETFPLESANEVLLRMKRRQLRAAAVLRI